MVQCEQYFSQSPYARHSSVYPIWFCAYAKIKGELHGFVLPQKRKLFNNFLAELANASWRCEQGGSHNCWSGCTGCCRPGRQPARCRRRSSKNHRVDSGESPNPNPYLAFRLICCPSTIPIHFRSCRKVRKRLPFWSLHPLFRSCCHTRLRRLRCRFQHGCSFRHRVQPIPILPL